MLGRPSWNPTWFVATQQTDNTWSVEAAIPLAELTGTLPESKHVWAVGLERTVPNVGFQSWTSSRRVLRSRRKVLDYCSLNRDGFLLDRSRGLYRDESFSSPPRTISVLVRARRSLKQIG